MQAERVYRELIWQDSDRVSGAICFYGTRVPVQHMFDHLMAGYTLEEFSDAFHLPIEQGRQVLALSALDLERFFAKEQTGPS